MPTREPWRFAWPTLVALAVALKIAYLGQYLSLPFIDGPLFDAQVYLEQAAHVRAREYGDPTLLALSPLYGYALVGVRVGQLTPLVAQMVLGLVNLALVRRLTARFFGAWTGLVAALLYLSYAPLLVFETKLMSETLALSLLLAALVLLPKRLVLSGLLLGLAVLARASLVFCLPAFAIATLLQSPRRTPLFVLALALPLVGNGLWNLRNAGVFVPVIFVSSTAVTTTAGPWTGELEVFRTSEGPVGPFSVVDQAKARLSRLKNGEPEPPRPPVSVVGWLRNVPQNAALTFRDEETTFDYGLYGERSELWVLWIPAVTFGALATCAAVGLWICVRERQHDALFTLLPIVAGILVTTTLFYPSGRYRLPIVLSLVPLAAHAVTRLRALTAVFVAFAIYSASRGLAHPAAWELRVAESALVAGDVGTCRVRVERAMSLGAAPSDLDTLDFDCRK